MKIAIVTGSNKGIGLEIVRGLCKSFNGDVILTARDEKRGQEAVVSLQQEGLNPKFFCLDINDKSTLTNLKEFILTNYGGLDVLVNNAGIFYLNNNSTPFKEQAVLTTRTNFWSLLDVCDELFPILKSGARVVHLSSMLGMSSFKKLSENHKQDFSTASTVDDIKALLKKFVSDAQVDGHLANGWSGSAYGMSKLGVTAVTPIQQALFDADTRKDIIVNCCCPGFCATDMTSFKGHKTAEQGAENPLFLALLEPGSKSPKGEMIHNSREIYKWKE